MPRVRHQGAVRGQARGRRRASSSGRAPASRDRRRGEVILCGGAINSPQLLQLSGRRQRERAAARSASRPSHDLPGVGENLQDHLEVYVQYASQAAGLGRAGAEVAQPARWSGPQWLLRPQRPGRDQPLRGRRLRPRQRRRRLPEPDVPLPADRDPLRRLGAAGPRLPGPRRADVLRRPRLGQDHLDRPAQAPGAALQLPLDRAGPPRVGRGDRAARARSSRSRRSTRSTTASSRRARRADRRARSSTGSRATPRRRCTRRAPAAWGPARLTVLDPATHGGARARGPARRRRLVDALRHQRQHLRAGR